MGIGFMNGKYVNINDPVIPIQERGHQFGDGVYEVVRVYHSIPFLLHEHLERLQRSAEAIQLELPYTMKEIKEIILEGISRSQIQEAEVYFQITRGIADRNHLFPSVTPSFTMTIRPVREIPSEYYQHGIKVITTEEVRWANCYIKSLNLLPNILAKQNAKEKGGYEAIFVKGGNVTEGSSTNIFSIKNNVLYTSPSTRGILAGITRQKVIDLALKHNIELKEEPYSVEFLKNADEVFITSTIIELLPVRQIDDHVLDNKVPSTITSLLHEAYKQEICSSQSMSHLQNRIEL